jgi:hypothetical protein
MNNPTERGSVESKSTPVKHIIPLYFEFEDGVHRVNNAWILKDAEKLELVQRFPLSDGYVLIMTSNENVEITSNVQNVQVTRLSKSINPLDSNCSQCGGPLTVKRIPCDDEEIHAETAVDITQPCDYCHSSYPAKQTISEATYRSKLISDTSIRNTDFEGTPEDLINLIKQKEKLAHKIRNILLTTGAIAFMGAYGMNNPDAWATPIGRLLLQVHSLDVFKNVLRDAYMFATTYKDSFCYAPSLIALMAAAVVSPRNQTRTLIQQNAHEIFRNPHAFKRIWLINENDGDSIEDIIVSTKGLYEPTGPEVTIIESEDDEEDEEADDNYSSSDTEDENDDKSEYSTPDVPDDCSIVSHNINSNIIVWVIRDGASHVIPVAGIKDGYRDIIKIAIPMSALQKGWQVLGDEDPDDPDIDLVDLYKAVESKDDTTCFGDITTVNIYNSTRVPRWAVGFRRVGIAMEEEYVVADVPDEAIENITIQRTDI